MEVRGGIAGSTAGGADVRCGSGFGVGVGAVFGWFAGFHINENSFLDVMALQAQVGSSTANSRAPDKKLLNDCGICSIHRTQARDESISTGDYCYHTSSLESWQSRAVDIRDIIDVDFLGSLQDKTLVIANVSYRSTTSVVPLRRFFVIPSGLLAGQPKNQQ